MCGMSFRRSGGRAQVTGRSCQLCGYTVQHLSFKRPCARKSGDSRNSGSIRDSGCDSNADADAAAGNSCRPRNQRLCRLSRDRRPELAQVSGRSRRVPGQTVRGLSQARAIRRSNAEGCVKFSWGRSIERPHDQQEMMCCKTKRQSNNQKDPLNQESTSVRRRFLIYSIPSAVMTALAISLIFLFSF